jgi:inorganic phosphate transporter, PiT family
MEIAGILGLPLGTLLVLVSALLFSLAFEAVNGFHDTANAVATVIYTNSLKPRSAVLLSGICNFIGVYLGGIGVAFTIVHLLPIDLLVNAGSGSSTAMVFAILTSAILWNVGTWYLGLPASSSHTLIGAIVGVAAAHTMIQGQSLFQGLYVGSFKIVFLSLLVSPILGFGLAALLLSLVKRWIHQPRLFDSPHGKKPPTWVRTILMFTSSGVSLAHGSNDGQKGVGLVMIILIGVLPAYFALNPDYSTKQSGELIKSLKQVSESLDAKPTNAIRLASASSTMMSLPKTPNPLAEEIEGIATFISKHDSFSSINPSDRLKFRKQVLILEDHLKTMEQSGAWMGSGEEEQMKKVRSQLRSIIDYAPSWVILAIAIALGCGTLVGWKRIVVTVGEKIGKSPLTYAQGASSETVAMLTIGIAAVSGLPVSTTHVLSSGVSGTMIANKTELNYKTVRDILLAWILTLPVSVLLAGVLFILFHLAMG